VGRGEDVPVKSFCKAGERKHRIAEAYLATHEVGTACFLVLVAKAPAPVWKVAPRAKTGAIVNIEGDANTSTTTRFTSSTRSGSRDDQDVGASAVRRQIILTATSTWPASRGGGDSIHQGRQLFQP